MNVLIVDDDKLARKGLVAIMDWKKVWIRVSGRCTRMGEKPLEFHPKSSGGYCIYRYRYAGN